MTEQPLPFYAAPDGLREKIRARLRAETTAAPPSMPLVPFRRIAGINWLAMAASLCLVAFGAWTFGARSQAADDERSAILDSHLRSLAPGHLTDVASTDQHTVKPWFAGKIDFSPPVVDRAADGFPLVGGRIDVVDGHTVAALVYSRASHLINVFVRPTSGAIPLAAREHTARGYHVVSWSNDGMQFQAISDLNLRELTQLRDLLIKP